MNLLYSIMILYTIISRAVCLGMVEGGFSLQIGGAFKYEKIKTLECFTCSQIILIFVLYCSNTGEHPHTDSDRFCLTCRHFCPGSLKTVASKTHVRQNTPPKKTVKFHKLLFEKKRSFCQKFEAVWPFGKVSPKS